ncbi:hypothetical protein BDA96_01G310800 [Sorghum bicolor]|uniref:Uncharacterized protein n=2 Tax=Sorghum bicolor TaxID=4558 RepID=A0A921S424_SORBI|nr:hypothetical protein BDA96_01G310800 [Sorghum bicolor]KXG38839.1 hypothetical protein SORBI_3001G286900 [Sorghum bicolor]
MRTRRVASLCRSIHAITLDHSLLYDLPVDLSFMEHPESQFPSPLMSYIG